MAKARVKQVFETGTTHLKSSVSYDVVKVRYEEDSKWTRFSQLHQHYLKAYSFHLLYAYLILLLY